MFLEHKGRGEPSGVELPFGYCLDESDPDILALRRQDGTFVAAFSARGATRGGITEAAGEDYRTLLLEEHARSGGQGGEQERSA